LAKNLKLNIKNTQIAEAVNLGGLKSKLAKKKEETSQNSPLAKNKSEAEEQLKEDAPRIRARSKSAFAEPQVEPKESQEMIEAETIGLFSRNESVTETSFLFAEEVPKTKTSADLRREIFGEDIKSTSKEQSEPISISKGEEKLNPSIGESKPSQPAKTITPLKHETKHHDKLGPTGRHIKDFTKPKEISHPAIKTAKPHFKEAPFATEAVKEKTDENQKIHIKPKIKSVEEETLSEEPAKKGAKVPKYKEFRDIKPSRRQEPTKQFDARDRQGLRTNEEESQQWRRKRGKQIQLQQEETIRPTSLKIRVPISIKDLASEMKLKASQLIGKLFLQGIVVTLNDLLEDETTLQLLGQEFGCEISIDTTEEKRIRITDETIREELQRSPLDQLMIRPPVVAFMGHVDHGKTSLIDAIRKSNRVAGEAGAITQHIGAFRCHTAIGDITVLDTPGHEAFSAMRARGADVTDIVVLVVAGDEGLRQQSIEAIQHAKAAKVTIVVAINKADKPNFNPDQVYRQLADQGLLPEIWGGQTITVNCSALTGEGIPQLLEMLALQAEVMELQANPNTRARGTVLESEMHKGLGAVATVLVQNGTLRRGDALVFGPLWGRIKNMHDEFGRDLDQAGPSTPIEITGLSGLPEAGQEFIVVKNEREAREIADARSEGVRQNYMALQQKRKISMENLFQQASETGKKVLNVILRADVQGSLEALKVALMKIESNKVDLNIIFTGVGEISESDVQLAAISKAVIIGFHTQIESHAEPLIKQLGVQVRLHDIIYHAIDEVKLLMTGTLEKLAQEAEKGKALVKTTFKSSQAGIIAGCQVTEGSIHRNQYARVRRGNQVVWKGGISSLKRVKDDVREVQKGLECGIILNNFTDIQENDVIETYELIYITQEL
jgi:translation initiation factor IF-2